MTPDHRELKANLALLTACLFWGISFSASKTALAFIPPLTVVFLRLLISSLCFWAWMKWTGIRLDFNWNVRWILTMILLSLFGTSLHYATQTVGIKFTTASNASVFPATGPILIMVISALFLPERITRQKLAGILLSLLGIGLVIGPDTLLQFRLRGHLLGDFLVLLSILMWAVFTVLSKHTLRRSAPLKLTALITFLGTLTMAPAALWEIASGEGLPSFAVPAVAWGSVIFLGVTCSFLATLLYVFALGEIDSQIAGIYLYTVPPIGVLFAVLFLKETIRWPMVLGIGLVILGVCIAQRESRKTALPPG